MLSKYVFKKHLSTPEEVAEEMPLSKAFVVRRQKQVAELKDIFTGKSHKFILAIGLCSADRVELVLDYITRLKKIQESVKDNILFIPRVYTGKPRTVGNDFIRNNPSTII